MYAIIGYLTKKQLYNKTDFQKNWIQYFKVS